MRGRPRKYARAFARALETLAQPGLQPLSVTDLERTCDWLLRLTPEQRRLCVRNSPRAGNPSAALGLVKRSYALRNEDVGRSLRIAEVAVEVADQIDLGSQYTCFVADIRAEAWGNLANTCRLAEDFGRATELWKKANAYMAAGSAEPLLKSELRRKQGHLLRVQKDHASAAHLLAEAAAAAASAGDFHLAAKAECDRGYTLFLAGEARQAAQVNQAAGDHLDPELEPEQSFVFLHNAVLYAEALGQTGLGLMFIRAADPVYLELSAPLFLLRAHWVRGRLCAAEGYLPAAVWDLDEVRRGFLARGLEYDAALATLDLAHVYARQRQPLRVRKLVDEMLPVLYGKSIPAEAAQALAGFADKVLDWQTDAADLAPFLAQLAPVRRADGR